MVQHKSLLQKSPTREVSFTLNSINWKLSPNSEIVNPQIENTLTAPNLLEQNNPSVVMATPFFHTLRGNNLPYVMIPDHNSQPKLNAQKVFGRNSVVLCITLYIYHCEVSRDDPMRKFTENCTLYLWENSSSHQYVETYDSI